MKMLLGLLMGMVFAFAAQAVWADGMGNTPGMSTPVAIATPATKPPTKAKVKKAKKKAAKEAVQAVWSCPMGDYSGPKTADGKCPKCGMDLVEKK
jgi:hypothetical protein